mgnify:CR=1 FL=1
MIEISGARGFRTLTGAFRIITRRTWWGKRYVEVLVTERTILRSLMFPGSVMEWDDERKMTPDDLAVISIMYQNPEEKELACKVDAL